MDETAAILVVDDDPYMLDALKRHLRREFQLHTVADVTTALQMVRDSTYAVVVADVHMPAMNGIDFLIRVSELSPQTVRIAFTGVIDLETRRDAFARGKVFRFLTKPCASHVLTATLREALETYRRVGGSRPPLRTDGAPARPVNDSAPPLPPTPDDRGTASPHELPSQPRQKTEDGDSRFLADRA